jgi:hypothetical protein
MDLFGRSKQKTNSAENNPLSRFSGVVDSNGKLIGIWLSNPNDRVFQDFGLFDALIVRLLTEKYPEQMDQLRHILFQIHSGDNRIEPNTEDDRGGCFVMFGKV